jgi:hypothetical protein
LASQPCEAALLDWFLETDPLDLGVAAPTGTPLRQDPTNLASPTGLALLEGGTARSSFVSEDGLRVTRSGKLVARVKSWRSSATVAERLGDKSPWVGAVRLERGAAPLMAAEDAAFARLDGRLHAMDAAISRQVGRDLVVAGALLSSADRFSGVIPGLWEFLPSGAPATVGLRQEVRTRLLEVRRERAGRVWQFAAERLDWRLPLKVGGGPTAVTLPVEVLGDCYRARTERALGKGLLVLEASRTSAGRATPISLPTFTTGRLDNRYDSTEVSVGFRVPTGCRGQSLRVALVSRSIEFSVAGRATVPASLGGVPGDSLAFGLSSSYRSSAVHVGSEWAAGPRTRVRAGVHYLRAKLSASGEYEFMNLFRLHPPYADDFDLHIADGRIFFVGLGASYCTGRLRLDAGVVRAFPLRSRDLDALVPPPEGPGLPRNRTTGGLLFGLAISRGW